MQGSERPTDFFGFQRPSREARGSRRLFNITPEALGASPTTG
jgi:hypothetical protein